VYLFFTKRRKHLFEATNHGQLSAERFLVLGPVETAAVAQSCRCSQQPRELSRHRYIGYVRGHARHRALFLDPPTKPRADARKRTEPSRIFPRLLAHTSSASRGRNGSRHRVTSNQGTPLPTGRDTQRVQLPHLISSSSSPLPESRRRLLKASHRPLGRCKSTSRIPGSAVQDQIQIPIPTNPQRRF